MRAQDVTAAFTVLVQDYRSLPGKREYVTFQNVRELAEFVRINGPAKIEWPAAYQWKEGAQEGEDIELVLTVHQNLQFPAK